MTYKHADQETLSLAQHAQGRKNVYQSTFRDTKANQTEEADDTTSTDEHLDARDTIDCENEDWYFSTKRLKPENRLKPAQRRLLLRNSGLVNIDRNEANSCKEIRDSRRHSASYVFNDNLNSKTKFHYFFFANSARWSDSIFFIVLI
jgi:hypothetical protein